MGTIAPLPAVPDSAVAQWAIVLGFVMPLLVSVVVQSHWPAGFKAAIAFLSSVLAATAQLGIQGKLDLAHLPVTALAIMAMSASFHAHFWKQLGISGTIEAATNLPEPEVDSEVA